MLGTLLVVLHVWSVFWLIAGIVARNLCLSHAARATDLAALQSLAGIAGVFDRISVRPGSGLVLLTGLAAAAARGYPILDMLHGGSPRWVLTALVVYLTIIPVIAFVFIPRGRVLEAALADAIAQGRPTPGVRRALADPVVGAARVYELVMVAVLSLLMITKPF